LGYFNTPAPAKPVPEGRTLAKRVELFNISKAIARLAKSVRCRLLKLASFHVYENGLEVWQDGKERPYLFVLDAAASEICGLCLSKMLEAA
jgi:hypothetical protein